SDIQLTADGFNFQFALFPALGAGCPFLSVIAQPPDLVIGGGGQRRTSGYLAKKAIDTVKTVLKQRVGEIVQHGKGSESHHVPPEQ
ncbi:hypothetical protein, partial [Escherichia coli]|uniref:hypothetical protein n=1 Tax=Escherichia coli TaxID=562 RepID=UPI001BFE7ED8